MTAASTAIRSRPATLADMPAIAALSARVFGPGRFVRTAYRVREGTPDVSEFCRVALLGDRVVAAIRMTEITIGGRGGALLLGPLAVASELANQGHGRRLIAESLDAARADGRKLVLLVGDLPYYGRLGFVAVRPGQIAMPGPVDPARLLAFELEAGALASFSGMVAGGIPESEIPRS
ncbi:MAG: GNAT family N-acetyltransferase [Hyphomicrobiaceae bacterium]